MKYVFNKSISRTLILVGLSTGRPQWGRRLPWEEGVEERAPIRDAGLTVPVTVPEKVSRGTRENFLFAPVERAILNSILY